MNPTIPPQVTAGPRYAIAAPTHPRGLRPVPQLRITEQRPGYLRLSREQRIVAYSEVAVPLCLLLLFSWLAAPISLITVIATLLILALSWFATLKTVWVFDRQADTARCYR